MINEKSTAKEISAYFNIAEVTIHKRVKKLKIKLRYRTKEQHEVLIKELENIRPRKKYKKRKFNLSDDLLEKIFSEPDTIIENSDKYATVLSKALKENIKTYDDKIMKLQSKRIKW